MDYEFHPAANEYPLLEGDDLEAFTEDCKENGILTSIKLYDGKILDGRNRYRVGKHFNLPMKFEQCDESIDPTTLAKSFNFHRLHMNETQLAMMGARFKASYQRQAKEQNQKAEDGRYKYTTGNLTEKAAKAAGTSAFPVKMAAQVMKHGAPSLIKALDGNSPISVHNAAAVATMLPPEEQEALVAAGPEAVNEKGKELIAAKKAAPAIYDPSTPEPLGSKGVVAIGKYLDGRIEHWARETSEHAEAVFAELNKVRMDVCGR